MFATSKTNNGPYYLEYARNAYKSRRKNAMDVEAGNVKRPFTGRGTLKG